MYFDFCPTLWEMVATLPFGRPFCIQMAMAYRWELLMESRGYVFPMQSCALLQVHMISLR